MRGEGKQSFRVFSFQTLQKLKKNSNSVFFLAILFLRSFFLVNYYQNMR